jgi:DNA end-binding protein Ku
MPATVWRGRIAFGMVSIPVRLHKAARRERIKFHNVYRPTGANVSPEAEPIEDEPEVPVRGRGPETEPEVPFRRGGMPEASTSSAGAQEQIVRVHNAPVGGSDAPLLKGYELAEDQYVVLEPKEITALRTRTSTELEIMEFVLLEEIDPIFFDTSYYLWPDRGGEKPYAILLEALRQSGYVALGSVAMHGREHAVVIRPATRGLALHTLYYANEVRSNEEYSSDPQVVAAKELELAKVLVQALAAKFEPEKLKDTFEERLRELIDSRAQVGLASEQPRMEPARAKAVDLMEALRKSLEAARKPVKSEGARPAAQKRRQTR